MDAILKVLRESGQARDVELSMQECEENREYNSRIEEVQKLSDLTDQYMETFGKNLNLITGHKHAINKVVNEAKHLDGLPISNKYHKQTHDFMTDAIAFMNKAKSGYTKPDEENNLQNNGLKLTDNVQSYVESTSNVFVATKSSVDKLETLMEHMPVVLAMQNDYEEDLERSIFDE